MEQKAALEKRKKEAEEHASELENRRDRKIRTIGNYVHESVPVSNNEVGYSFKILILVSETHILKG
jgi:seryl-tRNA synthetase